MVMYVKLVFILYMLHDLFYPGVGKLLHFSAFLTEYVFMMTVVEGFFIPGNVVPEQMFCHQSAVEKQIYGIV